MTPYPHPILAREGWPFIALAVGAALVAAVFAGPWWSLPLWLVAVFVVQFFRERRRKKKEVQQGGRKLLNLPLDTKLRNTIKMRSRWSRFIKALFRKK